MRSPGRAGPTNPPMPLVDTTQLALEAAMRGSMMRQTLLGNNLANVDTPGYQRQDVNFQAALNAAIESRQPLDQLGFQAVTDQQTVRADGNGVNPEQESANIAE